MTYVRKEDLPGTEFLKTPSATEERVTKQAGRIHTLKGDLLNQLQRPEVREQLGPSMGRFNNFRQWFGDEDPNLVEFKSELEGWLALQPAFHNFRGINALEHFERLTHAPITTPEALAAALRGIAKAPETALKTEVLPGSATPAKPGASGSFPPVPPLAQRKVGEIYTLGNGKPGEWTGTGFKAR